MGAFRNPFSETHRISLHLASPDHVRLRIFDESGKRVDDMLDQYLPHGANTPFWKPEGPPSGLYFLDISTRSMIKRGSLVYAKKGRP